MHMEDLSTLKSATKGLLVPYDKVQLRNLVGFFEQMHFVRGSRKDWQA